MKAYLVTTGTVFGLITAAHLARMIVEWPQQATEPLYLLLTAASAGLSAWAWYLFRRLARA